MLVLAQCTNFESFFLYDVSYLCGTYVTEHEKLSKVSET